MNSKAIRKQLLAAVAMVLVAAVALGSSTYAWFANNNTVTAKGMTVNATADASLLIKGTQDTVFSSIGNNALSITALKPSTSLDGTNFAKLGTAVKVESAADEKATWSGEGGVFQNGDLVTATNIPDNADTEDVDESLYYYATTTYKMKSQVEAADVYVKTITLGGTAANIDQAIRLSVTINGTTMVYNAGNGTTSDEGVGKLYNGTWSLATTDYTDIDSDTDVFSIDADTVYDVVINIWYEGQDGNCFTDNISTNNKTVTIEFAKA